MGVGGSHTSLALCLVLLVFVLKLILPFFLTSEAKKQIDIESCKRRNLLPNPKQKGVATKASSEDSSNSETILRNMCEQILELFI